MKKINKTTLFLPLSLLLIFMVFLRVEAIGMITDPIVVENGIRGESFIKSVTVFNTGDDVAFYSLNQDGSVGGWITFFEMENLEEEIKEVSVSPKEYKEVVAKINIPEDAPNGVYEGVILIREVNKDGEKKEGEVSITKMVSNRVVVGVSDNEIKSLTADFIPEKYDIPLGDPLLVRAFYKNTGNVSLTPDLQVKIIKEDGNTVFNAIFPYLENEERILPGERKEMNSFNWKTAGEERGFYRAQMTVLSDGEVLDEESFSFNLGNVSRNNPFLAMLSFFGGDLVAGILSIILFFSFLALFYVVTARKSFFSREALQEIARRVKSIF